MEKFLTGLTGNVSAGFIVGGGVTRGNPGHFSASDWAAEGPVLYSLQVGGSVTYTFLRDHPNNLEMASIADDATICFTNSDILEDAMKDLIGALNDSLA